MTGKTFSELALKPQLLARLDAMGFAVMTSVQAASLPALMAGKDVVAQASTGSGKTAAFALACLQRLDSEIGRASCRERV